MPLPAAELAAEARAAVRDALDRSHPAAGSAALRTDAGPVLPYTDAAIAAFRAAHARDPEDVGVAHHLAIAHHARAWDYELAADPRAAAEWETALGHWQTLAGAAAFWDGLKAQLRACDPAADPAPLAAARRDLMPHLLDVHVDFVRMYSEGGQPDRARAHVDLVRRARVAPAARKQLVGKVFAAMTGGVPEARAGGSFAPALTSVERFLEVFPDNIPALRVHAEVCHDWVGRLSCQTDWDTIRGVAKRAEPFARRLAAVPDLGRDDPQAPAAVVELAAAFARRAFDRASGGRGGRNPDDLSEPERRALADDLDVGAGWAEVVRGLPVSPGSDTGYALASCLHERFLLLYTEANEVLTSAATPDAVRRKTALRLLRRMEGMLERGGQYYPAEPVFETNLALVRRRIGQLEPAGPGGLP